MLSDEPETDQVVDESFTRISRRRILQAIGGGTVGSSLGVGVASANGQGSSGRYIVGTTPGKAHVARQKADKVDRELDFEDIGMAVSGRFPEEALNGLRNNPHVRYVEENGTMEALGETVPYGIEITNADEAIDEGFTGDGVSIAILDTGIDAQHETLAENLGEGWSATGVTCDTSDDCEPGWFCPIIGEIDTCYEEWDDDNGHGSHVAGTAAAAMNNTGVMGVAPNATLHSVKVLGCCGSGTFEDIAAGIEWAADQGHDVINMSLGGQESDAVNDAVEYAADNNVVMVAAAGNAGPCDDCVGSPADHPEVIAVSATNEDDELAEFSSTGPEIDIAAPGEDVLSSIPRDDYEELPGTSMASPHVAGAAATVIADGTDDREEVRDTLKEAADDIGLDDNEQGAGRLNVADAVDTDEEADPDVSIDIHTDTATDVGQTTATLNGELVEFEGTDEVEVWFEYGTLGSGFPNSTASADFSFPTAFSMDISGLREDTSYELRAVASAGGLTETGGAEMFTTETVVIDVETRDATEIDATSATLNGELVDFSYVDEVEVLCEYGPVGEGLVESTDSITFSEPTNFWFDLSDLNEDTEYEFRAVGTADDHTDHGDVERFTTETVTIDIETNEASDVGKTSATLEGELVDFSGVDEVEISFEYGEVGTGFQNSTVSWSVSQPTGFFNEVSGLNEDTEYEFRAVASAADSTETGGVQSFTTEAPYGEFEINSFNQRPGRPFEGIEYTVMAVIENIEPEAGTRSVQYSVEGTTIETREVEIDGESSSLIEFNHTIVDSGTYNHEIDVTDDLSTEEIVVRDTPGPW